MPAGYFPVKTPLRMEAGLSRLGGNPNTGATDPRYFQFDARAQATLMAKRDVLKRRPMPPPLCRTDAEVEAHEAVLSWFDAKLREEAPDRLLNVGQPPQEIGERYDFYARVVQEDFAVVHLNQAGENAVIAVHVCFPSGWRPERILGEDFLKVHEAVPEFDRVAKASLQLVKAMVMHEPRERFVWTLSADDELDHHPARGRCASFNDAGVEGYLRVERQVTVPFAEARASLFLIRTYLYPFDSLTDDQREELGRAVESMSEDLRRYKRIAGFEPRILELLRQPRPSMPGPLPSPE